jgi:hypothetical protein
MVRGEKNAKLAIHSHLVVSTKKILGRRDGGLEGMQF